MIRVSDVEQLYPMLPSRGIIAVDGVDGSGKSTLSSLIADKLGAAWFDLDSYIAERVGLAHYPMGLCYDSLTRQIAEDKSELIIVDGVYLRDCLEKQKFIGISISFAEKLSSTYMEAKPQMISNHGTTIPAPLPTEII